MTPEQAGEARQFWSEFSKDDWPKDLRIVGDYSYAWGTEWNGFLLIETEKPELFFEFWPRLRDKTRWYITNTRTVIGIKREPEGWLREQWVD